MLDQVLPGAPHMTGGYSGRLVLVKAAHGLPRLGVEPEVRRVREARARDEVRLEHVAVRLVEDGGERGEVRRGGEDDRGGEVARGEGGEVCGKVEGGEGVADVLEGDGVVGRDGVLVQDVA